MSEEPDWVPDDWNELQSLASDHGITAVGRSREDIVEDLKQVKDSEKQAEDDDLLDEDGTDPSSEKTVEIEKQVPDDTDEDEQDDQPDDDGTEEEADESEDPPETEVQENTIDLEEYIGDDGGSTSSSGEDSEDSQDHRGMAEAVNRAWGRIWTMDLDPDGTMPEGDQEVSAVRKNLCGLAQDVGLGENVKRFYEEEIKTGEEADPKKAMFGSLLMACLLSASARPDAVRKLKKEMMPDEDGGGD